jgi:hypothetical protein
MSGGVLALLEGGSQKQEEHLDHCGSGAGFTMGLAWNDSIVRRPGRAPCIANLHITTQERYQKGLQVGTSDPSK